jgi:hypothetical protein
MDVAENDLIAVGKFFRQRAQRVIQPAHGVGVFPPLVGYKDAHQLTYLVK